jgi:Fic family protein
MPWTSIEAHEEVERTGTAANHRALILRVLERSPLTTAPGIGALIGLSQVQVSRRMAELKRDGHVSEIKTPGQRFTKYRIRDVRELQGSLL